MAASNSEVVFVGSSDGNLRAFRCNADEGTFATAGSYKSSDLSFFALGQKTRDGSIWVFVSGKGSVAALLYSPSTEDFQKIAETSTAGSGTHLAAVASDAEAPNCHNVFLAHYHEHALSAFRFCEREGFGEELVIQPGQHPHQAKVRGSCLYVPCLGSNHIAQYKFEWDEHDGAPRLLPLRPLCTFVPGGPRHMAFLPHGPKALVLCELESRLESFEIGVNGALRWLEEASVFTHPDAGAHWSSDVGVRADGAFVYAINRDPPELVSFALTEGSVPRRKSAVSLSAPVRSFGMAQNGEYMLVGGEDGVLYMVSTVGDMRARASLSDLGAIRHAESALLGI